jgi:protein-disulfide isomerase
MVTKKKGGDLRAFFWVLGVIAVIAVGALWWSSRGGGIGGAATVASASIVRGEMEDMGALVQLATGVERGDSDAPITILEFGDFQCPACQQFAQLVKPQIDLAYVEGGIARFEFHDFPLEGHPHAFFAARAARCALDQGEEYFWPYHDELFRQQANWSASLSPPARAFEDYASAIGLNVEDFADCLDSDRHADVISANMRLGSELGVTGTPTIFVSKGDGGSVRVSRWNDFEAIKSVVDRMVGEEQGAAN